MILKKVGGIQLLEKAVQSAIYEKALKNHYIEMNGHLLKVELKGQDLVWQSPEISLI